MNKRLDQSDGSFRADHVNLRREKLAVRFFFARFSPVNNVTEKARMRAIEGLRNRLAERVAF